MKIQRQTQWTTIHADTGQEEVHVDSRNGETRESVVIIPTYNEAGNLKLLIPTILRQGPFDILIIDDNSPDGTGEVAERLAKRFPGRVSVLHRPGKLGLGPPTSWASTTCWHTATSRSSRWTPTSRTTPAACRPFARRWMRPMWCWAPATCLVEAPSAGRCGAVCSAGVARPMPGWCWGCPSAI